MKTTTLPLDRIAFVAALIAAVVLAGCSDDETEFQAAPDPMLVTGISPDTGPVAGGTAVRVFGTHFASGATVSIGGTAATSVTFVSATELTCVTPAGTAGAADVAVTNPGGGPVTLTAGFTYTDWTDPNLVYRRPITITGTTAGALTDYQVQVTVSYDAHMKADFSDIRFTHFNGTSETEAPFWAETVTDSTSATFWVRVPSIPASPDTTTIYAYYGNPLAASASNFDAVFDKEFDDQGLVGHWALDEGEGTTSADGSGNGLDAYLQDIAAGWGWLDHDGGQWADRADAGFQAGSALGLDGMGAHVNVPYAPTFDLAGAFSVEAWVKGYHSSVSGREEVIASIWKSGETFATGWSGFTSGYPQPNAWTAKTVLPQATPGLATVVHNGLIYAMGGASGTVVQRYDPATDTWTTLASLITTGDWVTAEVVGDNIYLIGGNGSRRNVLEIYDITANSWTAGPNMPTGRERLGSAVVNDVIYVIGGSGSSSYFDVVESYDPSTNTWTTGLAAMPTARNFLRCVNFNDQIWAIAGQSSSGYEDAVEIYDPPTDTWTTGTPLARPRGTHPACDVLNGKIYVCGGENSGFRSELFVYHPDADTWGKQTSMITVRGYCDAAVVGGKYYVAGGFNGTFLNNFEEYDPAQDGIGIRNEGYAGAAFDGRYVYFAPYREDIAANGEFLRYDTHASFSDVSSYSVFHPGLAGVGTNPVCYSGAVFDGRYVFFVPCQVDGNAYSEVLRYDTQAAFDQASSWASFDPNAQAVSTQKGYSCGHFDGRYVWFVPWYNGTEMHGEFLRYDTQAAFDQTGSWSVYDPSANGVGTAPEGYHGVCSDGRFLYFAMHRNDALNSGEILRFDTSRAFDAASSWSSFDPETQDSAFGNGGFHGCVFDGRFVYFVPYGDNSGVHGHVWRYDTSEPFGEIASWAHVDPGTSGVGADPDGFIGGHFDGRYVYFVQYDSGGSNDDEILRYDTFGNFDDPASWTTQDIGLNGGYWGCVSDGRYLYLVPNQGGGAGRHGEVARFDMTSTGAAFKLSWGSPAPAPGISGGPRGLSGCINTWNGSRMVAANAEASADAWHHVALTYADDGSGSEVNLYLDGALVSTTTASGPLCSPDVPLTLGAIANGKALLRGEIDAVRLYRRAMTAGEILAHYQRRKYANPEPAVSTPGAEETR